MSVFVDQLNHEVAVLRQGHVEALVATQNKIEAVLGHISALSEALHATHGRTVYSAQSHVEAAAVLALERAFASTAPLRAEVDALRGLCVGDELLSTLLDAIPTAALETGVPSTPDLRARFHVVRNEVRKNALAPANAPSVVGQAVGSVLATLSWAPVGFVPGEGIEEVLARAHYLLDQGDLRGCLKELQLVKGFSSKLIKDWTDLAQDRLAVEQITHTMRSAAALRHLSYANAYFQEEAAAASQ